jgi:hypothetical protein
MLRRPKHSKIEVVAPKEEEDLKKSVQPYIQAMLTSQMGEDKWSASRADRFN